MDRKRTTNLWIAFNIIVILAFIASSLYVWSFLHTQVNIQGGRTGGNYFIPNIQIDGLQVTVGVDGWTADGMVIPTSAPSTILNFPFIVFWIAIIGNLLLMRSILRKQPT